MNVKQISQKKKITWIKEESLSLWFWILWILWTQIVSLCVLLAYMIIPQTDLSMQETWPENLTWKGEVLRDRQTAQRTSLPHQALINSHPLQAFTCSDAVSIFHISVEMRFSVQNCGIIGKLCEGVVKVQHETPENWPRDQKPGCAQGPRQCCNSEACSWECIFSVCHLSISRYFYLHLSEGIVKPELPVTLQNPLFQTYYLNHWRYVGKTGHPIKPWKRPPVLTYTGGTESDSLWKEHLCWT